MTKRNGTHRTFMAAALAVCLSLVATAASAAPIVTLEDLNSKVTVDLGGAGMHEWSVDGVDHLDLQWFWFRVDGGSGQPIDALPLLARVISDGNFNPGDDRVVARYGDPRLRITVDFSLTGGAAGSGASGVDEVISLHNVGTASLDLQFYQFAYFDLNGTPADDSAVISGGNTVQQKEAPATIAESVVTSSPAHFQVDVKDGVNDILPLIVSGADLTDAAGPVGPGDLTWAFQWDVVLGSGDVLIISKKKNITPEPGAIALILVGAVAALRRRNRRAS